MKSILQTEKEDYLSGRTYRLEKHHIFFGTSNRKMSEKYGFWVWLTAENHRESKNAVHQNREMDLLLKRIAQNKFEETHTREVFMKIIGRNYL